MSLLFGYVETDEEDHARPSLEEMYATLAFFPHEQYGHEKQGKVSMGHMLTYNTAEALFETQPIYLSEKNLLISSTGRIDNREDLAERLAIKLLSNTPDGALIVAAYQKWGIDCVHQLRGDWTLAAYDFSFETLYLARCPSGYSSLYYARHDGAFYFSSATHALLSRQNQKTTLNEKFFIRFYTLWSSGEKLIDNTCFEGIYSLPLGSYATITKEKTEVIKFWKPENITEQKKKRTEDYTVQLLGLYKKAVSVRLRSYKPVASMLSGGL
jgi:asparagine synthase (glutamine-hydrolysing)